MTAHAHLEEGQDSGACLTAPGSQPSASAANASSPAGADPSRDGWIEWSGGECPVDHRLSRGVQVTAVASLTPHTAIFWCPSCEALVPAERDGTCAGCDSIIDLILWQETEEAWASDARAMECAEPTDPFFAPDRALNRGYL